MYRDGLVAHDRHGVPQRRLAPSGVALVASAGDAVWVLSTEQAWHVDAGGAVHGPFPWHDLWR